MGKVSATTKPKACTLAEHFCHLDPGVWTSEAISNTAWSGLDSLDQARRLYSIAQKLAPAGSPQAELMLLASDALVNGAEGLGRIHGFDFDLEVDV